jgi:translation initiation factor IF-2
MLCFDVKVDKDAAAYAEEMGVKIFEAQIIYHLFDAFTKHMEQIAEKKKEESKMLAVFPCVLRPVVSLFTRHCSILTCLGCLYEERSYRAWSGCH